MTELEVLYESEAHTRLIIETATDAVVAIDARGLVTGWNAQAAATFGWKREEALGKPIAELVIPQQYHEALSRALKHFLATGEGPMLNRRIEATALHREGREFPIELSITPTKVKGEWMFNAFLRDITERKKAEETLRQSEERFRLMVSSVKDYAIFMLDADGHVETWNAGAERIKGYRAEEIIGKHFSTFYPKEDLAWGKPERELKVAAAEGRFEDEGWRVRKDGSQFFANVIITALRGDSGELRGFSKVTRDITERKKAEHEVKKLNEDLQVRAEQLGASNKELEAFSYTISHDLRAPSRHIQGFAQILAKDIGSTLSPEARRYLEIIGRTAERMGQLIDDLLAFSRMNYIEMREVPVDLSVLVHNGIRDLEISTQGRNLVWKVSPLPAAIGDPSMLAQVFSNLLGNAVKYTRPRNPAQIEIGSASEENGRLILFVRDNGVGFDMKYVDKLFGVFQRLHGADEFEGTGVGLANVRRIIARHGGSVWAEGKSGEGATFYFTLLGLKAA